MIILTCHENTWNLSEETIYQCKIHLGKSLIVTHLSKMAYYKTGFPPPTIKQATSDICPSQDDFFIGLQKKHSTLTDTTVALHVVLLQLTDQNLPFWHSAGKGCMIHLQI